MNFGNNGFGRGRGRGRGQAVPLNAWHPQRVNQDNNKRKEKGTNSLKQANSKEKHERTTNKRNNEDDWKARESARESRLEKAKKIKENAAEKFSHLLEDSGSSDEELREEEILRKTMDTYKQQFVGMIDIF